MTTLMVEPPADSRARPLNIMFPDSGRLSGADFFEFCQLNRDLRIERASDGVILIMPPAGGATGSRNGLLTSQLHAWAEQDGSGVVFDSSTGFELPNSAVRSPDAAWVAKSRLARLTSGEREGFLPLVPDFVIELKSPSDQLKALQSKIVEYMENGCRLGWLLDPDTERVYVYEPGGSQAIDKPGTVSAGAVLPGFTLDLASVWKSF